MRVAAGGICGRGGERGGGGGGVGCARCGSGDPEHQQSGGAEAMTDLELKKLIGAALMVPPTDNWHYPLSENQLRHLIARAVEAEREQWPNLNPVIQWLENGCDPKEAAKELRLYAVAIRARGESK
jgi:hypothetical protein